MGDDYFLTGPGGTQINIGSYVRQDPGPDFDDAAALDMVYQQNALSDRPRFAYERRGVRSMKFPLLIASGAAGMSLDGFESLIRMVARPGAVLDLKLDGVPSSAAVRFDVLGGKLVNQYSLPIQRAARRMSMLQIDTEPLGYWPTWITIASVASMSFPGTLQLAGGRVGDAPGFAELIVNPTVSPTLTGSWLPDLIGWSMAARGSDMMIWPGASMIAFTGATWIADAFAPVGATAFKITTNLSGIGIFSARAWIPLGASAPAGDYRIWAWTKLTPSGVVPMPMIADLVPGIPNQAALASSNPIATITPNLASAAANNVGAYGAVASSGYILNDLGIVRVPSQPPESGGDSQTSLRFWVNASSAAVPSVVLTFGGVLMQRVDGPAGLLTQGLQSLGANYPLALRLDSFNRVVQGQAFTLSGIGADLVAFYRGQPPYIGATVSRLDLFVGARQVGTGLQTPPVPFLASSPAVHPGPAFGPASVRYRPRFTFTKGI